MLILLSDGAGLTARQTATVLARAGHRVEALSPAGLCLCRMNRHVRRVHDVPALGRDPSGWLEAALAVAERRGADVLDPVQEQVAVMAWPRTGSRPRGWPPPSRLRRAGPGPGQGVGVPDAGPGWRAAAGRGGGDHRGRDRDGGPELARAGRAGWPLFVKMPIGTASAGVRAGRLAGRAAASR